MEVLYYRFKVLKNSSCYRSEQQDQEIRKAFLVEDIITVILAVASNNVVFRFETNNKICHQPYFKLTINMAGEVIGRMDRAMASDPLGVLHCKCRPRAAVLSNPQAFQHPGRIHFSTQSTLAIGRKLKAVSIVVYCGIMPQVKFRQIKC
ncbi:hypothetical protein RRG08_005019 [Elysia crispata]|uniref:Uncharacterized protein n=1 Tax=Elysia crispata TaxID=231223 RepID=A0AAE1B2S5_9GAST|nr:hypothetical protein RRG08_005019 [Elysia crispata]